MSATPDLRPIIAITMGDASGIGPEIIMKALARDDVDAVAVCVPSGLHARLAVQVLEAGRHLVVEKPVDVTVAAARTIADAAERAPAGTLASDEALAALREKLTGR